MNKLACVCWGVFRDIMAHAECKRADYMQSMWIWHVWHAKRGYVLLHGLQFKSLQINEAKL